MEKQMTTRALPDVPVRSLQDILTALERHPEWRAALRQQLLGEELLELPALFARFASETTKRFDAVDERFDGIDKRFDGIDKRFDGIDKRFDGIDKRLDQIANDVGMLKGAEAERKARENIGIIADELGLEYQRTVPRLELRRLAKENGADLREDRIKSFVVSDIIAETTDEKGETTYLVVEASFTADVHDLERAQSHEALMERFTKKPCRKVIASKRNTERLRRRIERGDVQWHELPIRIQPAD